jgi:hypothetical protein
MRVCVYRHRVIRFRSLISYSDNINTIKNKVFYFLIVKALSLHR